VDDLVWLWLLHQPVASLDIRSRGKLGPKFYGPFCVVEKLGEVAYKLELPARAWFHDVLHVGLLKPDRGMTPEGPGVLPLLKHGRISPQPAEVIKGRIARGI
jgi:hypothetical protein